MKIGRKTVLKGLPKTARTQTVRVAGGEAAVLNVTRRYLQRGLAGLQVVGMRRFLALEREGMWWNRPTFGASESDVADDTQYLLYERDGGGYGLLLPLVEGDLRACLAGGDDGLTVGVTGAGPDGPPKRANVLIAALGDDPYELSERGVAAAAKVLRSFRTLDEKRLPNFVDDLGWCTWDAFYRAVDARKVLDGLETFHEGGVRPGFVILDDGWQDVDTDRNLLNSFDAERRKFPNGLAGMIEEVKDRFGVRSFLVWTTLQGYWDGVSPTGPLGERFEVVANEASSPKGEAPLKRHFVHPEDAARFFQEWHDRLRRDGVDGVKVDSQSSLMAFTNGRFGQASAMGAYQHALQGAAQTHFNGALIHCMCNGSDVAYHMLASTVWRNSDDFYPARRASHPRHVHINAMNNMWTRTFALPDWDMFQSGHEAGAYHAAARAVSGGPVYVSDRPDAHDFDLLRKLTAEDGRVLRCPQPAVPARDCLMVDCSREPTPLKISNRAAGVGLLGLFNCCREGDEGREVSGAFRADDVVGLAGARFAVRLHGAETLNVVTRRRRMPIELDVLGWEIATVSPIVRGVAPLGLLDKLNGPAAIVDHGWTGDGEYTMRLWEGGLVGMYCAAEPTAVLASGATPRWTHDADTGLLAVKTPTGKPVELAIRTQGNRRR